MTFDTHLPQQWVSARDRFGIPSDLKVPAFLEPSEHVPTVDPHYHLDPDVTLALLAGFAGNRRVLLHGLHGSGKSTHVEQVAARLNWPCVRVNLDGQISRLDLIGRDGIVLDQGQPRTVFQEGILPWAVQRPVALVLDEYDAGQPDVMFVVQRLMERGGRLTLMDQDRVLVPHVAFRLFGTANTIGMGNLTGLYHGTQRLNQAQLDRWDIVASTRFPPAAAEETILTRRVPSVKDSGIVPQLVHFAQLTRNGFMAGDLSTLMSTRTLISWAENLEVFGDLDAALRVSFVNRCPDFEVAVLAEYFQRCFDRELQTAPEPAHALQL